MLIDDDEDDDDNGIWTINLPVVFATNIMTFSFLTPLKCHKYLTDSEQT